jgi:hypothetical protein
MTGEVLVLVLAILAIPVVTIGSWCLRRRHSGAPPSQPAACHEQVGAPGIAPAHTRSGPSPRSATQHFRKPRTIEPCSNGDEWLTEAGAGENHPVLEHTRAESVGRHPQAREVPDVGLAGNAAIIDFDKSGQRDDEPVDNDLGAEARQHSAEDVLDRKSISRGTGAPPGEGCIPTGGETVEKEASNAIATANAIEGRAQEVRPEIEAESAASNRGLGRSQDTSPPEVPREDKELENSYPPRDIPEKPDPKCNLTGSQNGLAPEMKTGSSAVGTDTECPEEGIHDEEISTGLPGAEPTTEEVTPASPAGSEPRCRARSSQDPGKYTGLTRRRPGAGNSDTQRVRGATADTGGRQRSLPIEIRLRFDRGGFCSVGLIARRSPGQPDTLSVVVDSGVMDLHAMQDEWYQDVISDRIATLLQTGVVWRREGDADGSRWSLSGRELYVLGNQPDVSGWISQPCLKLGRKHMVLCTERIRLAAEEVLRSAGVDCSLVLDVSHGCPEGWLIIRDVVPVHPVPPVTEADILNALRPLPELEMTLEGGIRLEYATWLEEYPPLVRVYGDPADVNEVLIDGRPAVRGEDGACRAPGWDARGTHNVWCKGVSRSYTISSFEATWEPWHAHTFPLATAPNRSLSICGPLVWETSANRTTRVPVIEVPETHSAIIGAIPGQCTFAMPTSRLPGSPYVASPSFEPVWALPPYPLHCTKGTDRILFLGEHVEPSRDLTTSRAKGDRSARESWARLILDASRKGLTTAPDTERVRTLWAQYKRVARQIWRSSR